MAYTKFLQRTRIHMALIIMAIGLIAVLFSLYNAVSAEYGQNKMLKEFEVSADAAVIQEAGNDRYEGNTSEDTGIDNTEKGRVSEDSAGSQMDASTGDLINTEKESTKPAVPVEIVPVDTVPEEPAVVKKEDLKREDYKGGSMVIDIPKLDVRAAVIDGTTKSDLKKGPCLFEISQLPDIEGGNVCIAAHRDRWFRYIDRLVENDEVILEFNGEKYTYKVEKVFIAAKNDWSVTESTGYSALTLVTCISITSSEKRIIVRAKQL